MKIDLHNHSTHSDGAWSVQELINQAKNNGVDVMALTDHDSCFGVEEAKEYGKKVGVQIIAGIEISTTYNDESVHVLGFFPNNIVPKEIHDFADRIIKTRHERAVKMMKNIEELFNLKVDYDYLFSSGEIVTRGNMARTLVHCNESVNYENSNKYVGNDSPAYIPASKLTTRQGITLLHKVGAIAILAHPVLIKKTKISELLDLNFDGLEYRYPRNTFYDEERFKTMALERKLYMTSGSDCHGDASHALVGTATYDYDGFKPIANRLNIKIEGVKMKIKDAEFVTSGTKNLHLPTDSKPEFMFCGRSNVGKSSFINALLGRKSIARVSQRPGKTQTLNVYMVNQELYFIDVPGYGYAAVSKKIKEEFGAMIEEYIINRKELKKAFLLVDLRHAPTKDDKMMYDFIKYYHIPLVVIATKQDKVKRSIHAKQKKLIMETLGLTEEDTLILTSSETKAGMEAVLNEIESSLNELKVIK